MAPDGSWKDNKDPLPRRGHYHHPPVLKDDEVLVEFRGSNAAGVVRVNPGETVVGVDNVRYPYEGPYVRNGGFKGSGGRYIVRKKNMGTCDKCGEPYVIGALARHYETCTRRKMKVCEKAIHPNNQEVEMAEQKPLSYKRETLIEALNNAVAENEKKRAEDRQKKLDKDKKAVDQVIMAMKSNPRFAGQMLAQAAALVGPEVRTSEDVGKEVFRTSVQESYPDLEEAEIDPDADLKKLIRVYEKAEDETVEVHVHDTVYNYL